MLQAKNKVQSGDYKSFIQEFRSFRKKNPALPLSRCLDTLLSSSNAAADARGQSAERN
ncbi:MAG: hypothetical protein AB7I41_20845 [Candidatus Sericytochromatia bacterium]